MSSTPVSLPHRLLLTVITAFLLVSCGTPASTSTTSAPPAGEKLRIGMVLASPPTDGGWGAAGVEGLRLLREKYQAEIDYVQVERHDDWQQKNPPDWEAALRDYADKGYPIVFAHGRYFDKVALAVAPSYPNTRFIVTGGTVSAPNVASGTLKNEEAGYMLGVIAGLTTKSNTIGIVAGVQMQPIASTVEAFKIAIQDVNPDVTLIERNVAEQDVDKVDGANAVAESMIDEGADIIFTRSSAISAGVIQVAKQHGIYVINYGKDLTNLAPKTVLANGIQVIPVMMDYLTNLATRDTFEGQNYVMGLNEGVVMVSEPQADLVPEDVRTRMAEIRSDLISGKIKLDIKR